MPWLKTERPGFNSPVVCEEETATETFKAQNRFLADSGRRWKAPPPRKAWQGTPPERQADTRWQLGRAWDNGGIREERIHGIAEDHS